MNKKTQRILRKYKSKKVGIFIDDANMFHTQREVGWLIDWRKLKVFLEENFKVKIYLDKKKTTFIFKCDFDAEIGFDVAFNLKIVDLVILVSGDSDFVCLNNKLVKQGKNFLMTCFDYKAPWEVRKIHHIFLEDVKERVILRKEKPGF